MKKTLVAIAALALVGAASAQSSVNLTGKFAFAYKSANDGQGIATSKASGFEVTDGNVVFAAVEDLGGGLKVGVCMWGRVIVRGQKAARDKNSIRRADYVLYFKPGIPLAVVEAKDNKHSVRDGIQQALDYAAMLDVPFAFSSNGDGFVFHDKTLASGQLETELTLDQFPAPELLWQRYLAWKGITPESQPVYEQDYHNTGKFPRYYQTTAVNRAIEPIAKGQARVLLVMATCTGKTYTTFWTIWPFFQ